MFGPAWMWLLGGGWMAKTVVDRLKQPGAPGAPQQPRGPQAAQVAAPPQPQAPAPLPVRHGALFDRHMMNVKMERAIVAALEEGNPAKLRGFAASLDDNVPPQYRPHQHFPIAAYVMRKNADAIEQARRAAAPPPAPAPVAATPAPAPPAPPVAAAPTQHVNGAASPATAAIVNVEPAPHAES